MSLENLGGKVNKDTIENKSGNVSSTPFDPFRKPERRGILDSHSRSGTMSAELMEKLTGQLGKNEVISPPISDAMKLHQRLERAGGYERLEFDPRRRVMLQKYLTTPKSAGVIGEEEGIQNRQQAHQLIRSAMDVAFSALPEDQRAEYDNNPAVAWRPIAEEKTHTKGEKIKEALDERKNPETGKIEFSDTHLANLKEAITKSNQRRGEQIREGTYKGKPVGRPRKSEDTSTLQEALDNRPKNEATGKIESSETQRQRITKANFLRWERERAARKAGNQKKIRRSPGR